MNQSNIPRITSLNNEENNKKRIRENNKNNLDAKKLQANILENTYIHTYRRLSLIELYNKLETSMYRCT